TRFSRDWNSDVCSSDLAHPECRQAEPLHTPVPGRSPRPGWLASISARPSVTRIAMSLRLLTIATLLLGGTAQAGGVTVYKYTDAAGVVTYSDRAVPGAAGLRLGDEAEGRLES